MATSPADMGHSRIRSNSRGLRLHIRR
jgi:hypothetical protein